jgi:hypothetical protein|tara:strand:+ start:255 stop:677 length:423 start_codon:yes stop_codon:yes gene_type:complete
MSFIPSTQSELAVSNLYATIANISTVVRFGGGGPRWLASQVDSIAESLDSYCIAGGDPSELSLSIRACEVLSIAVRDLLESGYHLKPFVDEDWFYDRMNEIVLNVNAIAESLGEPCYGSDLCDRWNAFIDQDLDHCGLEF